MDYDPASYEMLWRKNFEFNAFIVWLVAILISVVVSFFTDLPKVPLYWMIGIGSLFMLVRYRSAMKLRKHHKALQGVDVEVISVEEMLEKIKPFNEEKKLYLGKGFNWENRHAQKSFEILKLDWREILYEQTLLERVFCKKEKMRRSDHDMGAPWIHGLELEEHDLSQLLSHTEGHTLITGTTGAGKTRLFQLLSMQCIAMGQATIMIDPKGDVDWKNGVEKVCKAMGQPEKFVYLHPAFPENSARIDPMKNFSRPSELASRIAELIPSESGSDAFKAFGWQALNNVINGLVTIYKRPTLKEIKRYLEGGTGGLVSLAIEEYAKLKLDDWEKRIIPYQDAMLKANHSDRKVKIMISFYENEMKEHYGNTEIEALISMFIHDPSHFAKMIASLLPIMNMLTSGELGELLSPNVNNLDDPRPILDSRKIINNKQAAYIGLDSLTDGIVGSAIGSIFTADLTAVAGDRYNYEVNEDFVNIFVDETSEVITDSLIQLLNKGRGAKMRLFIATQTIPDFADKLRSRDKALRVLGNINNIISLRVLDNETQNYIVESMPKTRLKSIMRSQGYNTDGDHPVNHGGNVGERLVEEEKYLFEPQLLGYLPNLEYIAKISGGRIIKGRLPVIL